MEAINFTQHKIIFGDSRKLSKIDDCSIHLVITSPPYWQLKDYEEENQIGFDDSYEDYINSLNLVWLECYRVLHSGCRLCINIGDQFARSIYYGRYKIIPIRDEIIRFCETIGFDFMGSIIWQKVTTCNTTGGANIMGSFPYPRNGIIKIDYEYILLFKKIGIAPDVNKIIKEESKLSTEEWKTYFSGHWYFPGSKQDKHLAMFPEELPKRLIKMFSFVGETIFDPFIGSGTTSLAAANLRRNSIGYEINDDFQNIIREKVMSSNNLYNNNSINFVKDNYKINIQEELSKLPYKFSDTVKLNKKFDIKKLTFGSKIDKNTPKKQEAYLVKEIVSPDTIMLQNGLKVKLIGVEPNESTYDDAIEYLKDKVKGKKVLLKFSNQNNNEGVLIANVFLENKTSINKHYLRTGLVIKSEIK